LKTMLVFAFKTTGKRMPARALRRSFSSENKPLFDKILVANRGEIACRVFRSAKKMGIKTVAVYSEADADANHVHMADEKVLIGPAASADSYLRQDRILEAIESTGAQAVHPGYGFLSENAEFSKALKERGIKFMGPGEFAIDAMGDKIHSKKIASDAKVNTIPGYVGAVDSDEELLKACNEIGYPVMIKASAGGGGKGMRIAWNDDEALQGFRLSKREAAASFGDDTIFVEKFVENPRHIEIQILVDSFGNGIYLNERECSVQRRNQKVIEEAPSVFVDPETRAAMGAQALQLAKAVDYQSAGTVEFLMDKHKNFYFLEMNTRLQVEHPITEMITKVDIVEQMIKVAAGLPLDYKQEDIGIHGWAIESRVYAEDPYREFLPSTGLLTSYKEPSGPEVRVDTGVREGSEISMFYDPMISKLVTHADTRDQALERMRHALDTYRIEGLRHNLPFLRSLCDHPDFISGEITTKFIQDHYPDGYKGCEMSPDDWINISASIYSMHEAALQSRINIGKGQSRIEASKNIIEELSQVVLRFKDGPVVSVSMKEAEEVTLDDVSGNDDIMSMLHGYNNELQMEVLDVPEVKEGEDTTTHQMTLSKGQKLAPVSVRANYQEGDLSCETQIVNGGSSGAASEVFLQVLKSELPKYKVAYKGQEFEVEAVSPRVNELYNHMPVIEPIDFSKMVISPMPGLIYSINVKEGQEVSVGQEVCVVEAMKMQNALQAPSNGTIVKIAVEPGQSVDADEILIELE